MNTGRVYLVHDSGAYLRGLWYYSRKNRNEIVEGWRKMYGHRFNQLYLHFSPTVNIRSVNEKTGLNHRQKKYSKTKRQVA